MGAFHSTQNSANFGRCIKRNGPFPLYSGPALKLVLIDRPGYFGRSDRNVPFHLTKLLSQYRSFVFCNQKRGGLGRVFATGRDCSIGHVEFPKFQIGKLLNGKRLTSFTYKKDQRGLDGKANDLMLGPKSDHLN